MGCCIMCGVEVVSDRGLGGRDFFCTSESVNGMVPWGEGRGVDEC